MRLVVRQYLQEVSLKVYFYGHEKILGKLITDDHCSMILLASALILQTG